MSWENYWGVTKENIGIWNYNPSSGKVKCSWKGEIFPASSKRFQGRQIASITYSSNANALLISYGAQAFWRKSIINRKK